MAKKLPFHRLCQIQLILLNLLHLPRRLSLRQNPTNFHNYKSAMLEKIEYREFWDVPRLFIVRHMNEIYLFNCRFDESIDDYPDVYKVYRFSEDAVSDKNWEEKLDNTHFLGEIKISDVRFDLTKRKEMNADILDEFLK